MVHFLRRKDSRDSYGGGSISSFSTLTTKFTTTNNNVQNKSKKGANSSNNDAIINLSTLSNLAGLGGETGGSSSKGGGDNGTNNATKRSSFLGKKRSNADVSTSASSSSSSSLPSLLSPKDQQVLLDYMVDRLPSLDPILNSKLMNNPCDSTAYYTNHTTHLCAAMDISSVYDSLNETFNNHSSSSGGGSNGATTNPASSASTTRRINSDSSSSDLLADSSNEYDSGVSGAEENNGSSGSTGLRFGTVQVREYNRTVGDHPDVSDDGPPLTIDWAFVQLNRLSVNQYEAKKRKRRQRRIERRNSKLRLEHRLSYDDLKKRIPNLDFTVPRIKGHVRREILHLDFDVPFQDLIQAELEVKRIQQQREESNAQSPLSEKTEEIIQSASRKIRRSFTFGRNSIADRGGVGYNNNNYSSDIENNKVYHNFNHDGYQYGGVSPRYRRHHYNHNQQQQQSVLVAPKLSVQQYRRSKAFSPSSSSSPDDDDDDVPISPSSSWGEQHHLYKNCYRVMV